MASEIRVNTINNRSGLGTISITNSGAVFSGVTTFAQIKTTSGEVTVGTGASVFSPATNVLALGTNNTERVRISSTGSVGIGTDNPGSNLHIKTTSSAVSQRIESTGNNASLFLLSNNDSNANTAIWFGESGGNESRGYVQYYRQGDYLRFGTNSFERLRITSSGNIGIGTTNPATPLHVEGNIRADGNLIARHPSATGQIFIQSDDATYSASINVGGTGNGLGYTTGQLYFNSEAKDVIFNTKTSAGESLRITSSGDVGIGDATPAEKLEVKGDVLISTGQNATLYLGKGAEGVDGVTKIKSVQTGTDTDELGIAFFTHPSTFGSATSVEKVRIDSSGRLLVGTDSDTSGGSTNTSVQIVGNADNKNGELYLCRNDSTIASSNPIGTIEFRSNHGGTYESHARIQVQAEGGIGDGDKPGRIMFFTTPDGTSTPTEKLRISQNGNVQIANGNLVFSTSGTGIDFSATANSSGTMTSELLDDYEEGSWTPVIQNTSVAPSYSNQVGRYTKIGRVVYAQGFVQTSSGATYLNGNERLFINGLPYASSSTNSVGYVAAQGNVQAQSFNFNGSNNDYSVTGQLGVGFAQSITGNDTGVMFYVTASGGIRGTVKNSANAGNSFILEFNLMYIAD